MLSVYIGKINKTEHYLIWHLSMDTCKFTIILIKNTPLINLFIHKPRAIAKQLIRMPQWPCLMRHAFKQDDGKETTAFRKMIKIMPGILLYMCHMHVISTSTMVTQKRAHGWYTLH